MDGPYRDKLLGCKSILLIARETSDGLRKGAYAAPERAAAQSELLDRVFLHSHVAGLVEFAEARSRSELELGLSTTFPMVGKSRSLVWGYR